MNRKSRVERTLLLWIALVILGVLACGSGPEAPATPIRREDTIPSGAVKMNPEDDPWQPVAALGWSQPAPLEAPVNTAGGEDSPFLTEDWDLYFFFTPDVQVPASGQVGDGVTGIWQSKRVGDAWTEPQRLMLSEPGEPHLDGCPFVLGEWMAFCSVRAGNKREIDIYTAERKDGIWTNVKNWGEPVNQAYRVGELHISTDGHLYFASDRPGGMGELDLWVSSWDGDSWDSPVNLGAAVNTAASENRPFITADGGELWFDGVSQKGYPGPAVFRSVRQPDGSWGQSEEIISSFAGEPNLSADGNTLLFVHHYFSAELSQMIEADIYLAVRLPGDP